MAPRPALDPARTILRSSSGFSDLVVRLRWNPVQHRRKFQASCQCQAGVSAHDLAGTPDKGKGLSSGGRSDRLPVVKSSSETPKQKNERLAKKQREEAIQNAPERGALASNSIFAEDLYPKGKQSAERATKLRKSEPVRNPDVIARVLNPRPRTRALWHRKMLIRSLQKRDRLTKEEKIMRTERSHLAKSHFFDTSIKKLAPLARQIAGKTIDEAILQMRFSKKKVAKDVRKHLIHARNEAILARGMGFGSHVAALPVKKPTDEEAAPTDVMTQDTSTLAVAPTHNPILSLKRHVTPSETQIYIAQAWVNRGPYDRKPEHRAMGRTNILRPPHTGLSVLLKEEKTRTREVAEKEQKDRKQRLKTMLWTQLPDRKIYGQRPYYTW